MLRTLLRRHVHKPLIRFPDRKAPSPSEHQPHPHPAAPAHIVQSFSEFLQKREQPPPPPSTTTTTTAPGEAAADTHFLPERFWRTNALQFSEEEIEAVMMGGASA